MPERRGPYDVLFYMPWMGPLLNPGDSTPPGGAETQIFLIAQALAARGARVCIMAFDTEEGLPERYGDIDVVPRPLYDRHARWTGKIREAASIARELRRIDARVVVTRAQGPQVGIVGLFARLYGRRYVYSSAHVGDFTFGLERQRRNWAIYRLGIRLTTTLVVQTEEQIPLSRRHFGREPVLIRSMAQPMPQPSGQAPEAFLWIARLVWYKRPLEYLELARRLPDAKFWMVAVPAPPGEEELADAVRREAAELPNVELLEPRPRDELMELVDRSVAIVNTADSEGMANIFLEGWGKGVPALALAHDPDGLIERHGLGGFAGGSMDRLAELARELWDGRGDRERDAGRCRTYIAEHHSPDVVAERWLDVIGLADQPAATTHELRLVEHSTEAA
jgi:glycosyltransferase involved in cell wall biosynthesis